MNSFDATDVGTWEEEVVVAGEPGDPEDRVPSTRPSEMLAPEGGVWARLRRRLPYPRPAPPVAQTQRADRECTSIEDIYTHYRDFVWSRIQKAGVEPAAAEDILQEVFLIMDNLIHKTEVPKNVPAMLTSITKNLIGNHLRQRARRPRFVDEFELDDLPASQPDVEQRVRSAELRKLVKTILAKLPLDAAMLIELIDVAEMTQEEVAGFLKRPLATVKTQHRRARIKFRELAECHYKADLGGGA